LQAPHPNAVAYAFVAADGLVLKVRAGGRFNGASEVPRTNHVSRYESSAPSVC